jgi:hypothetical protein
MIPSAKIALHALGHLLEVLGRKPRQRHLEPEPVAQEDPQGGEDLLPRLGDAQELQDPGLH